MKIKFSLCYKWFVDIQPIKFQLNMRFYNLTCYEPTDVTGALFKLGFEK